MSKMKNWLYRCGSVIYADLLSKTFYIRSTYSFHLPESHRRVIVQYDPVKSINTISVWIDGKGTCEVKIPSIHRKNQCEMYFFYMIHLLFYTLYMYIAMMILLGRMIGYEVIGVCFFHLLCEKILFSKYANRMIQHIISLE